MRVFRLKNGLTRQELFIHLMRSGCYISGKACKSLGDCTGAAGYQIEYSASKKFTSAKVKDVGASMKKTISGLKAGRNYVRLRAYSLDSMKSRIYGEHSAIKSVTVKD